MKLNLKLSGIKRIYQPSEDVEKLFSFEKGSLKHLSVEKIEKKEEVLRKETSVPLEDVLMHLNLEFEKYSFEDEWVNHNLSILSNYFAYKSRINTKFDQDVFSNVFQKKDFQNYLMYQMASRLMKESNYIISISFVKLDEEIEKEIQKIFTQGWNYQKEEEINFTRKEIKKHAWKTKEPVIESVAKATFQEIFKLKSKFMDLLFFEVISE